MDRHLTNPYAWVIMGEPVPTIDRDNGFEIVIHRKDHPPPHVHVIVWGEGELCISLTGEVRVVRTRGSFKDSLVRAALALVQAKRIAYLQTW